MNFRCFARAPLPSAATGRGGAERPGSTRQLATPSPHPGRASARRTGARAAALLGAALLTGCGLWVKDRPPAPEGEVRISYPAAAIAQNAEGTVRLRLAHDAQGVVQDARIERSSGNPHLDAEALRAGRAMRLRPGIRNGQPVSGVVLIPIRFRLEDALDAPPVQGRR